MNFDDPFTRDSEEKFQKNLESVRGASPEAFEKIEQNLRLVFEFLEDLKNKPDKTPQDFDNLKTVSSGLKPLSQKLSDMKLILDESLYRKSKAYYEHVKKLAKEGNKEAEKIYLDLKDDFESFDPN